MSAPSVVAEPTSPPTVPPGSNSTQVVYVLKVVLRWVLAILGAMVIFSILISFQGANPLDVFQDMWVSTFQRPRSLTEILTRMAPITLCALAVVLPARAGMMNVGGQGQLMLGAIGAAGVGLACDQTLPGGLVMLLMAVGGMVAGAAWAGIAALLRIVFNVNEAVTTLLLNFVALDLLLFLIYQPWRENAAAQPSSREVAVGAQLPTLGATGITVGIVVAIAATLILGWALARTRWGFKLGVVGGNAEAARRAALPVTALLLSALLVGGALAGLAGWIELSAVELKLRPGFGVQIGYIGFLASWLARHRPLPVLLASFVLAALSVAADSLQLDSGLPAATINILTALLLIAVLGWTTMKGKKS